MTTPIVADAYPVINDDDTRKTIHVVSTDGSDNNSIDIGTTLEVMAIDKTSVTFKIISEPPILGGKQKKTNKKKTKNSKIKKNKSKKRKYK
jgi:hypothetical protein